MKSCRQPHRHAAYILMLSRQYAALSAREQEAVSRGDMESAYAYVCKEVAVDDELYRTVKHLS